MPIDDTEYRSREEFKSNLRRSERLDRENNRREETRKRALMRDQQFISRQEAKTAADISSEKEISERLYNLARFERLTEIERRDLDHRDALRRSEIEVNQEESLAHIERDTAHKKHILEMAKLRQELKGKLVEKVADFHLTKKLETFRARLAAEYGEAQAEDILNTLNKNKEKWDE